MHEKLRKGSFALLPVPGKKAVLEWCMKEGLIGSSYVCPKCGKKVQEMKLPVRLISTTNEQKLFQGHERHTAPLRVKGDIEHVSSELDKGVKGCTFWMKRPEFYCSR
ncbi:hypothetical protein TNCV_264671 [Trichonephila clavipes]|nr:hypothetical protein TNCV_264671 [Trichonephila clavipes]